MSYTLAYKGAEIDEILGRAATGGALDTAIAAKQDVLTFDAVPTEGSTNPAESGGIYDAIQAGGATALAAFATDTVSGDVASFPDGADGIPVKAFTGSILPQQNLNGQSAPYPAGGGKNLLPMTVASIKALNTTGTWSGNAYTYLGVTYTIQTDGGGNVTGIATSGTASGSSRFDLYHDATDDTAIQVGRILNGCPSGGSTGTSSYKLSVWGNGSNADAGSGVTIYAKNEWCSINVYNGTNVTGKTFYPMIRLSTEADATFAPYSNICPISGWTGANITHTGANVMDATWEQGAISYDQWNQGAAYSNFKSASTTRARTVNLIDLPTTEPCTVSVDFSTYEALARPFNANGGSTTLSNAGYDNAWHTSAWQISGAPKCALMVRKKNDATITAADVTAANVQINIGSTALPYEPYNGQTITLTFGSTVYAGTLTALGEGLWRVQPTHEKLEVPKTGWAYANGVFYLNNVLPSGYTKLSDTTWLCNAFAPAVAAWDTTTAGNQWADNSIGNQNSASYYRRLMVKSTVYGTDAAAFMAGLPSEFYILYPLATLPDPITITGEDLQTLLGANTVWTDVGSITGMTYRADTALYIQKLIGGGGTLSTLSMASPSPSLSLGRVGVLAEPEEAEPEQTDEEAEQLEQTEEPEQAEEE